MDSRHGLTILFSFFIDFKKWVRKLFSFLRSIQVRRKQFHDDNGQSPPSGASNFILNVGIHSNYTKIIWKSTASRVLPGSELWLSDNVTARP